MRYVSTRGGAESLGFSEAMLAGLAADGGLLVPETMPRLPSGGAKDRYGDVAATVLGLFAPDWAPAELDKAVEAAYHSGRFDHPDVVSVTPLTDDLYLGGLSHGPTLAFKDMALQLLGELFEIELERRDTTLTVLGATSGDTGSSAEYAMIGKRRVAVYMLSPHGRMSPFQAAQMYSLDEPNIHNLAVRGVFDQCQDLVKAVNADAEFKAAHNIGAVNSINWVRIAAQVAYYVYLAERVGRGRLVDFAVPTGNFGNVYAGYVAKEIGAPIRRLIVATNENDVLAEFFETGVYRVREADDVFATSSPSMDIAKASNFERYVYDLSDGDTHSIARWFDALRPGEPVDLASLRVAVAASGLHAGTSTHSDRLATIRAVADDHGRVIDPHTADGVSVGMRFAEAGIPLVCLETAQPVKFGATIHEALGRVPDPPVHLADLMSRPHHVTVIDPHVEAVKAAIVGS